LDFSIIDSKKYESIKNTWTLLGGFVLKKELLETVVRG